MNQDLLLHSADVEVNGEMFEVKVFSGSSGRFFAKTSLGQEDVIITDGPSAPEALKKHQDLLPLAVGTREITQSYMGFVRRGKGRRY